MSLKINNVVVPFCMSDSNSTLFLMQSNAQISHIDMAELVQGKSWKEPYVELIHNLMFKKDSL